MNALRGKGLNDDDRQQDGIDMQVVSMNAIPGSLYLFYLK